MLIKNALVLNSNFEFEPLDLSIHAGKITAIAQTGTLPAEDETIDLFGLKLVPGFVNIHIHGCMGCDTMDASYDHLNKISSFLVQGGVTSFLPTTMTMPLEDIQNAMASVADAMEKGTTGAEILGINQEGPFISIPYKGAHDPEQIRPATPAEFERLQSAAKGAIRIVTIAPEAKGALDFIKTIKTISGDTIVSLGHTGADFDTCIRAIEGGANLVTHLFSAMPPLHHRNLSLIAAAAEKGLFAELICDGVHIDPVMVRLAYRLFGSEKIVLITDSICAAGLEDGVYTLGGQTVFVREGQARNAEGNLAGGTSTMIQCIKNLVEWGIPQNQVFKMAAYNPCRVLGLTDHKGTIAPGLDADLVAIDDQMNVKLVIQGGKVKQEN